MSIVDTPFNTTSRLACLASKGVTTIIRYYNFSNSRSFPEKALQLAEAQSISAHNMNIAVVFQQRQTQVEDFSEPNGLAAGRRAYRYAHDHIGQTRGSAIYFSVDFDATDGDLKNAVIPYFQGVKRAFAEESGGNPAYLLGAYGSGAVCTALTEKELIKFIWLAMSRDFRGTREALQRGEFHLTQLFPPQNICGLDVDVNEANPDRPDFGTFTVKDDAPRPGPSTRGERFKVIARNGLRLREGPSTAFDVVGMLRPGQIVFVASVADGWARIDVEGDGHVDGFAAEGFLERVE
jgi:hypothetical protein